MATLREVLNARVREGDPALWEKLDRNRVRCYACGHCCPIPDGQPGVCKVRFNRGGTLYVPWGYVAGVQCDPIEKKPFFHAYPGALAYSFGMLGCDLHCSYCQNWVTSQALRDPEAVSSPLEVDPKLLVKDALVQRAKVVVSTYNEPLITSEWAVAVFREARQAGLVTAFVSNGNGTRQVLDYLHPWIDLYKVDLKSFDDLPIPFRCVATDLTTGTEHVFKDGSLAQAMRSTMSMFHLPRLSRLNAGLGLRHARLAALFQVGEELPLLGARQCRPGCDLVQRAQTARTQPRRIQGADLDTGGLGARLRIA